ncbi:MULTISPECIES: hypothetical protein [Photorhabdus]|nr:MULTISPECIES: hypothetical protein [Photorhabdus]MCC8466338.1 hypothetical protein [Photorhabdus bodei]MDB6367009.1 hypothetical protein [Photorhabdus bodei]NDK94696.1 hypothetical protein [Photorhabdus laumondii subsp. laumondii]NDL47549.1 hypothetical protein [Photorhabdus laumondii subsp. laumondii]
MTGVSECSQQRGNLKDDGYISYALYFLHFLLKQRRMIKHLEIIKLAS